MKKFNQVSAENERKRRIIIDKQNELMKLKEEVEMLREKARERDNFNTMNKELVTKYYGQSTAIQEKDKRITELKSENAKLQEQLREGRFPQRANTAGNGSAAGGVSTSPQRGGDTSVKKQSSKASDIPTASATKAPQASFNSMYGPQVGIVAELLFRGLKKQPWT